MSDVKERILGALTVMSEDDALLLWNIISKKYNKTTWKDIAEAFPDEVDLKMIKDIKENPECKEFISAKELMNELKIEI